LTPRWPPCSAAVPTNSPMTAASGWCVRGICRSTKSWPYRSGHCALPALARPRQRLRVRPLFVGDLTSLQAPVQEPRPNAIGWLSRRGFARAVDLAHPEALLDHRRNFLLVQPEVRAQANFRGESEPPYDIAGGGKLYGARTRITGGGGAVPFRKSSWRLALPQLPP
jgi:hypothetical protein